MERLSQAGRIIADIRIGADRLLEAMLLAVEELSRNSDRIVQLIAKKEASMEDHFRDLRTLVGAEADEDESRITLLLSEVDGKDINELIAAGREKFASVPSGGGGGVAIAASAGGAAAPAAAAEAKKEETRQNNKSEPALFGIGHCVQI